MKRKFPRSVAKFIRVEKARIRRTTPEGSERARLETELMSRVASSARS